MMAGVSIGSVIGWFLSELASKVVNDSGDAIKNGIMNAVKDRNADPQNMQIRFYQVIISSLNEVTHYKYKDQEKLYDAAEFIVKGLLQGKSSDAISAGLKLLDLKVTEDLCDAFVKTMYTEISKDKNNMLYNEMNMLLHVKNSKDIHEGFQKSQQNQEKMMDDLDNIKEQQSYNNGYAKESIRKIESRTKDYADKWDKDLFLNHPNKRDDQPVKSVKLSQVYLERQLPSYIWKMNGKPRYDMKDLLKEYVVDHKDKKMLLILGQPGIGKSTLITWLTANFKEQQDNIYVYQFASDLKKVNWQTKDILEEILDVLHLTYEELEDKTLILDGFDEISMGEGREQILNRLYQELEVTNCFKRFSLIITCRENYIQSLDQIKSDYTTLQAWNRKQIKRFCEVYGNVGNCRPTTDTLDELLQNEEIFGIPLILYMVLALNVSLEKNSSIVDIYDQIFSLERGVIYDRCYDVEHRINDTKTKKLIHNITRKIAFWIFENNADEAFIPQGEFKKLCNEEKKETENREVKEDNSDNKNDENSEKAQSDVLIGNYFTKIKHCEGMGTDELQFVHRSIYEYFVTVHFFESICNLTSKEEIAGKLGELLKEGQLSKQILEYIKCKFDQMKRNDWPDMIKDVFQIMLQDGMTYYVREKRKSSLNIMEQESNIFVNMLELVSLWNDVLGKLDDKVIIYIQSNRRDKLNLMGIVLSDVQITDNSLAYNRADLQGAYLSEADLIGANLRGADLRGAKLSGANLSEANLRGADLQGAYLIGADLRRADLQGTDLRGADLIGADLIGADLIEAKLSIADLSEANLSGANLSGADLRGAGLSKTDLVGADLKDAIFNKEQVKLLFKKYNLYNSRVYLSSTKEVISYKEYRKRFLIEKYV